MMPLPCVSVVVPTRDRPFLLARTLASVLASSDVELEVVVVDDGSSPPVRAPDDRRVVVVRNESPIGVARARNVGLGCARGRWVAFCDDDDLWAPTKLRDQVAALQADGTAWSCVGAARVDERLEVVTFQWAPPSGDLAPLLLGRNVVPGGGSGVVASSASVRELGGFDPELGLLADWDLWVRLALAGPVSALPVALMAYRYHSGAMSCDQTRVERELAVLDAKYAVERSSREVELLRPWYWLLSGHRSQRGGARLAAARQYLAASPAHRRALLLAAEALVWPGASRLHDRRHRRRLDPGTLAEVEAWLAPLRDAEAAAAVSPPGPGPRPAT